LLVLKRFVTAGFSFVILLVIFYFAISIFGGAVSGVMAGVQNPENAVSAGEQAGSLFVQDHIAYITISSLILSLVSSVWLSFFGVFPWCRPNKISGTMETQEQNDDKAPAQWGLLGTVLWGIVIATIFIILQFITMLSVELSGKHNLTEKQLLDLIMSAQDDGVILSVSTIVTTIVCSALVAVIIKLKRGSNITDYIAIRAVPLKILLKWLGFLAVFIAVSEALSWSLGRPIVTDFMATMYASAHPVWIIWIALIVAAPLFEETFFRGFLLKGFTSSFIGPAGAIVLTAALWAIVHNQYDAYDIAMIFFLGLMFGSARIKTGSILVPLAMHALVNLVSTMEAAILN